MQAAQMGERFHFLFHAAEEMDQDVFGPLVEALDNRMTEILEQLRTEGLIRKEIPNA